ncbi:radical SAM/SPASM domain-containing protein [Spirochaetia bacterium]|nr:radical SAM/SPASM domain-containing protein [Spirochaetia bacterium]
MPPVSILIKSASAACNLRCEYCFYRAVSESREQPDFGLMQTDTLEALVKNALQYADGLCSFAFQGGEPTLAGLGFYRQLIEFQQKYNPRGLEIENTIQTNGILIDDDWAAFLSENNFLVGLSLDGPRKINDRYRHDTEGSFGRIMGAAGILERYKVRFNILSVITASSGALHMYRFFRKQDFRFLQLIPCLADQGGDFSLKEGDYGRFLTQFFDLWYEDFTGGRDIDIRFFSNLVRMAAGFRPEACGMAGFCTPYLVVEGDGSVYPCDFYVRPEWKLGTVYEDFQILFSNKKMTEFAAPSGGVDGKCVSCVHFALCRGGCRRWREPMAGDRLSRSRLCADYELFFDRCSERIYRLAAALFPNRRR